MTLFPQSRRNRLLVLSLIGLTVAAGAVTVARAQTSAVASAIASGAVGEQADGYLGIRDSVAPNVRSEVESINIKRRAGYTNLAQQRGVTVQDVALSVGCQTLATRVGPGQAYRMPDGSWHVRDGDNPIPVPSYCS